MIETAGVITDERPPDSIPVIKEEIIRMIQRAEGHRACFGTPSVNECGEPECLWVDECLAMSSELIKRGT